MADPKDTVNQVRQILMNELGLTREWVRAQMENIIEAEVERHARAIVQQGGIEKMIHRSVEKVMQEHPYGNLSLKASIAQAVSVAVKAQMMEHLPEVIVRAPSKEETSG